ncbi:MAG: sigma factor-like helix-turn-helix DNA-binding protein [Acutalibacteraceae bacterium]|jgi:RNA polymerase sigma factor (sigma-70 family)|nr:sigma factor-like helix-turn-helix DNA-binding protein [Acutalibacteraceae bacterium]
MKSYATEPTRLETLSQKMAYSEFCMRNTDNQPQLEKMKKHIQTAVGIELTERQRYCITEYYINSRKMVDISKDLNITPSVVSRHISRGIAKLKKTLPYFNS